MTSATPADGGCQLNRPVTRQVASWTASPVVG